MYAFVGLRSACESLRFLGDKALDKPRWPQEPRALPSEDLCVHNQRMFKQLCAETDLPSYGIHSRPVDLLTPSSAGRSRGKGASPHVWQHVVPSRSMVRITNNVLVSSPELILMQMAGHHTKLDYLMDGFLEELRGGREVQAMADEHGPTTLDHPLEWEKKAWLVVMALIACEFSGTYRLSTSGGKTSFGVKPLMSHASALAMLEQVPDLYAATRVRTALDLSFERSASPMETALALMLSLPAEYGGYGIVRPEFNPALAAGEYAALWEGGDVIHPDLYWEEANFVLEYDSDEEHANRGERKAADDATRSNVLVAMGKTVLRATTATVRSLGGMDRLARCVAVCLGKPLPEADELTLLRRHKLHVLLTHPQ